ncbi:hypothetical protein [Macrococcus carouselicus]|uniref:DUF3196 domain-containing protein n=1 Tax=Macrococcus carouselicus TaxID=69969 RepID=A0A9Q8FSF7_9STAP|nr:hypothetical protein [Macrococcus carouselicus]TDM04474.1 hypothetical protein ERX40_04700 [Macrococcus carouselicus]
MSEIIPFPGLSDGLNRQLQQHMAAEDFKKAYDIITELERHAELTDRQQLQKLRVLYELESYLELREEASIMLNQGHPDYEETVYYFLLSLLELTQYQTVIELIDALRAEEIDHRLKMKLLPLYDQARHKKNERDRQATTELADFLSWSADRQKQFILRLISDKNLSYASTFIELLKEQLHPVVQSLLVQYVQLTGRQEIVTLSKLGRTITFNIGEVAAIDQHTLMQDVRLIVADWFDSNMPDMTPAVTTWLEQQAVILYPLTFHTEATEIATDIIADCYIYYALSMFSLEEIYPVPDTAEHQLILDLIQQAVNYEL